MPDDAPPESEGDCECCYGDLVAGEISYCSNPTSPHKVCFGCAKLNAETEFGKGKSDVKCISTGAECTAHFSESELRRFLDPKFLASLDKLRTENSIREAGLENLVECPFCPFVAIMDDPTDFIFACANPECGIHSCRNCRVKSHDPLTCQEYIANKQKDKTLSAKHAVEEAMTEALISKCNKCKRAFLKDEGCNKMTCSCGNKQCYVCGKDVKDYDHFGEIDEGKCALYDDHEERLRQEVATAQQQTVNKLLQSGTDLTADGVVVDKNLARRAQADRPSANAGRLDPQGAWEYRAARAQWEHDQREREEQMRERQERGRRMREERLREHQEREIRERERKWADPRQGSGRQEENRWDRLERERRQQQQEQRGGRWGEADRWAPAETTPAEGEYRYTAPVEVPRQNQRWEDVQRRERDQNTVAIQQLERIQRPAMAIGSIADVVGRQRQAPPPKPSKFSFWRK